MYLNFPDCDKATKLTNNSYTFEQSIVFKASINGE